MAKQYYLDYAGATPLRKEVFAAMRPFFTEQFANPSSIHSEGQAAAEVVEQARGSIAKIFGCKAKEIIFTSCGSESINLVIQGVARAKGKGHIITSLAEHAATLRSCEWLEAQGFQVTYLRPDQHGVITAKQVQAAIQEDTILITLLYASNEVGTINPIAEIAQVAKTFQIPFHIDSCQAAQYLSMNLQDLGVDMMTINASKIYGPKGVAVLYVKEGTALKSLIFGGKHEHSLRAGTLNVPGIIGIAKALELAESEKASESTRLAAMQEELIKQLLKLPDAYLNGHKTKRLPNNINISFLGVDAETLVRALSAQGLHCSSGSACSQGTVKSSHVLEAMGKDRYRSQSSLRISLGKESVQDDVEAITSTVTRTVISLRKVQRPKDK